MELVVGMFVIALVLSAFFYFIRYIVTSLRIENALRQPTSEIQEVIELDVFAADEVFGLKNLPIKEPRGIASLEIPRSWSSEWD